jgi:hypothetical protein
VVLWVPLVVVLVALWVGEPLPFLQVLQLQLRLVLRLVLRRLLLALLLELRLVLRLEPQVLVLGMFLLGGLQQVLRLALRLLRLQIWVLVLVALARVEALL